LKNNVYPQLHTVHQSTSEKCAATVYGTVEYLLSGVRSGLGLNLFNFQTPYYEVPLC
jgi:hypothetical protein